MKGLKSKQAVSLENQLRDFLFFTINIRWRWLILVIPAQKGDWGRRIKKLRPCGPISENKQSKNSTSRKKSLEGLGKACLMQLFVSVLFPSYKV